MQPITAGRESKVFKLGIAELALIIKRRIPEGRQNYRVEGRIYRTLMALGAHVPHVVLASRGMLVMKAYAGEELEDKIELFDHKEIFCAVAQDLALCRNVPVSGFGELTLRNGALHGTSASWMDYLELVEPLFESTLLVDVGLSKKTSKKLSDYWFAQKPSVKNVESSLLHGDFAMSAIFVLKESYEGLIDFGDAIAGDSLADLAYWRYKEITKPYGYKIYRQMLEPYRLAMGISDNLETERIIRFYMIYWGLKRLKDCPDRSLRQKFGDKLSEVAKILDSSDVG